MAGIRYKFRKTEWTDLEDSPKALILGPKMVLLPHFGQKNNFPPKKCYHFLVFIEPKRNVKNIMRESREKSVTARRTDRAEFMDLFGRARGPKSYLTMDSKNVGVTELCKSHSKTKVSWNIWNI